MPIYDLTLDGPLHVGEYVGVNREAALEWLPSDSLFAACVTAWVRLGMDVEGLLRRFAGFPPFWITSAFPRAGAVRFYPAPPLLPGHCGLLDDDSGALHAKSGFPSTEGGLKRAKGIRWLSQAVLDDLAQGRTPASGLENFLHGGSTWLSLAERRSLAGLLGESPASEASLWKFQIVPRVTLDRQTSASALFHTGRVTFGPGCGLWFALDGDPAPVRPALDYLSEAGLGGLRSTGHGGFTWQETDSDLPRAVDGWGLLLSRYAPQVREEITEGLQQPGSAYGLVNVGGWCQDDAGKSWRRRPVRLVAEGALLPASARGGLVDVRPQPQPDGWSGKWRPVLRNGLAYCLPAGKMVEVV